MEPIVEIVEIVEEVHRGLSGSNSQKMHNKMDKKDSLKD